MDHETRCMREWKRKLIREAISDYLAVDGAAPFDLGAAEAAWEVVDQRFAERHAHVANAPGSFDSLTRRDRARWAYNQETNAARAKHVAVKS